MSNIKDVCCKPNMSHYVEYDHHVVRGRRYRLAYAPMSNTASNFFHEKCDLRVSMSMGLHLAALQAAGALPQCTENDTSLLSEFEPAISSPAP